MRLVKFVRFVSFVTFEYGAIGSWQGKSETAFLFLSPPSSSLTPKWTQRQKAAQREEICMGLFLNDI